MFDGCICIRNLLAVLLLCGFSVAAIDEYSDQVDPMLQTEPAVEESAAASKVTRVYGVNADDYLPKENARRHLRPNLRDHASSAGFDLPDAFYFVGGPIFVLILFRVLVIFLNGFEEARREELNMAVDPEMPADRFAGEALPGERIAGD